MRRTWPVDMEGLLIWYAFGFPEGVSDILAFLILVGLVKDGCFEFGCIFSMS